MEKKAHKLLQEHDLSHCAASVGNTALKNRQGGPQFDFGSHSNSKRLNQTFDMQRAEREHADLIFGNNRKKDLTDKLAEGTISLDQFFELREKGGAGAGGKQGAGQKRKKAEGPSRLSGNLNIAQFFIGND